MMKCGKVARDKMALSPLLAIIIGLVVTIVAGILLAQLFFSYAATISARPGVNLEYVDAIDNRTDDVLAINLKNVGNVPVNVNQITITGPTCTTISRQGNGNPGTTISVTCRGNLGTPGTIISGSIAVPFADGSNQVIAFSVRIRSA